VASATARASQHPLIDLMVKQHDGNTYIFAVNMTRNTQHPTISLHGLPSPFTATVYGENRTITTNNQIQDTFTPFAIHIYIIRQQPEKK
jgi:hypothetical protein